MKKYIIVLFACLAFTFILCSQENRFFFDTHQNHQIKQIKQDKHGHVELFFNPYYQSYDGCDIFVDFDESVISHDVNAVFLIEPSLSYDFAKMIEGLPIKRAVITISFICFNDSTASIQLANYGLYDKNHKSFDNKQLDNKLENYFKEKRARVLLNRKNKPKYICGLLFNIKDE